jgi:hypothetical protein
MNEANDSGHDARDSEGRPRPSRPEVPTTKPPTRAAATRLLQVGVGVLAIAGAFALTYLYPERNGLEIDIDNSARAQEVRAHEPYDLTQRALMNRVLMQVVEHYVEPERIEPRRMLLGGLNAIQGEVAPVLVDYEDGAPSLTL